MKVGTNKAITSAGTGTKVPLRFILPVLRALGYKNMRIFTAAVLFLLSGAVFAENSASTPIFMPKSTYESSNPAFTILGVEKKASIFRIWLVSTPELLNDLEALRKITKEIYSFVGAKIPEEADWEAIFYSEASTNEEYTVFQESNYVGLYMSSEREFFMRDGRSAKLKP